MEVNVFVERSSTRVLIIGLRRDGETAGTAEKERNREGGTAEAN